MVIIVSSQKSPTSNIFGLSVFLSIWKFDKQAKKQERKLCELFKAAGAAIPMQFRTVRRSENPWGQVVIWWASSAPLEQNTEGPHLMRILGLGKNCVT